MAAIVAHGAVIAAEIFSEVVEEKAAAAGRRLGVGHDFLHQLRPHFPFGNRFVAKEFLQFEDVLVGVESHAAAFQAVAAGAACFLIIVFDAFGDIEMDDKADVGFVDTHAEGDRGYDNVDLFHQEVILRVAARSGVQAGMVGRSFDVVDDQRFCDVFS